MPIRSSFDRLAFAAVAGLALPSALSAACSSSAKSPFVAAESPDADGGVSASGTGSAGPGSAAATGDDGGMGETRTAPPRADAAPDGPTAPVNLPASCSAAVKPYTVTATTLDSSVVPVQVANYWGGTGTPEMRTMVAVDSMNKVYAGVNVQNGSSFSTVIAAEGSAAADMIKLPAAILGGLATTKDGLGALLYDPTTVDQRLWAQVKRLGPDGKVQFSTDLFRSANLTDDMTKGNPARGRLAYVPGTDELVAYFGHMEMLQMVRHEGGYVAKLSASGAQTVLNGWFGSHNIDQRLVVDAARVGILGLGDAYPVGFFFSFLDNLNTNVVYTVAGDGQGDANGQMGGIFALSDVIVASFVTDKSIAQNTTAGTWPNIDQTVAMQIAQGGVDGTDVGLLLIPKTALPQGDLKPVWVNVMPASGAHLAYLKSVQYGSGDLILLAWAEQTGSQFAPTSAFYTMVVDRTGAVCQPRKALAAADGFAYDDIVRRPDGAIVWANGQGGVVHIVTLTP